MKITHIATECAPFAKSGGLGDVVYGLSRKCMQLGCHVDVIIPGYKNIDSKIERTLFEKFSIHLDGETFDLSIYSCIFHEITVYTIESSYSKNLFNRDSIYGEQDDTHRFLCFSYFALTFLDRKKIKTPDILHIHDWPTAFCAPFLRWNFPQLKSTIKSCILTIHNLKYQGIIEKKELSFFNLPVNELPSSYDQHDNNNYLNIMKSSIEEADHCVIVSPTYLKEIMTNSCGEGLEHFIEKRKNKFSAILNGIDTDYWNPSNDKFLHSVYNPEDLLENVIEAKYRNKRYLQKKLGLSLSHAPLYIFITRLTEQKGPYLIKEAIHHIEKAGSQCILLGSEPSSSLKKLFSDLKSTTNVYIDFRFQEELSHLCYAAADAIVIPSIYEPCGLTQMIGMRYGTIPIVRKTGGLSDTVFDIDHSDKPLSQRNGFVFEFPTLDSMDYIINRADDCFKTNQSLWRKIMENCLSKDVSFHQPALEYCKLYNLMKD